MIEPVTNVPENVVAFRASGHVSKEDYESILIPAVDAHVKKFGKINFLYLLDTKISNFSIPSLLDDLKVGLKHFSKWHKIAVVSESGVIRNLTDAFNFVAPGELKGFTHKQMREAIEWVSS